jgi:acetyltransferase-like isoleucine patch superfamily enzyme
MSEELRSELAQLHYRLRKETRAKWKRVLPFFEELSDRWERAAFLGFGEHASIYENSYVYGDVEIGRNTWVGPFTILDGSGHLKIGDHCSISSGVQIYTHDTVEWAISGGRAKNSYAPVTIGNCCYIGSLTVVSKGVTIGDHCVVGAASFVNKSIPSNSVAFGTPAKVVGRVIVKGEAAKVLLFSRRKRRRTAAR